MDPSSTSPAAPAVSSAADPDATQVEESKPAAAPPAEEAPTASEVDKPQAEPEQGELDKKSPLIRIACSCTNDACS